MRTRVNGSGGYHIGFMGRPTIYMGPNDGKGGGGGGGGGGNNDDDDDEDAKFEKKFETSFNKFFHKAMGERDSRFEKKIMKNLDEKFGSKFDELKSLLSSRDDDDDDDDGDTPPKKKDVPAKDRTDLSPEARAEMQKAQQMAKEAKDKADKWEKEANAAKEKARKTEERNQLSTLLGGAVKPALLDMVIGQLHGRVVRDEEDEEKILFKQDDGTFVPLKDGIDSWKKSDAGKEVAPPRAAGGSGGSGPGGSPSRDPKNFSLDDLGALIAEGGRAR